MLKINTTDKHREIREERISYLRDMADELRAARYHIQQFNLLCDSCGYVDDKIPDYNNLQSNISQEINWLDV